MSAQMTQMATGLMPRLEQPHFYDHRHGRCLAVHHKNALMLRGSKSLTDVALQASVAPGQHLSQGRYLVLQRPF